VTIALALGATEASENEVEADWTLLETGVLSCSEAGEGGSELEEAAGADADLLFPDLEVAEVAEFVNSDLGVTCRHPFCGVEEGADGNCGRCSVVEVDEEVEELEKQLNDFCLQTEAFGSCRIFKDRADSVVLDICVVRDGHAELEAEREEKRVRILDEWLHIELIWTKKVGELIPREKWPRKEQLEQRMM
jgi:hypothetical protein